MREAENIDALQTLDVDWMGMIFFKKSARNVEENVDLVVSTPRVGVFVNEIIEVILEKVRHFSLTKLQLHGDESPAFCRTLKEQFSGEIIKGTLR